MATVRCRRPDRPSQWISSSVFSVLRDDRLEHIGRCLNEDLVATFTVGDVYIDVTPPRSTTRFLQHMGSKAMRGRMLDLDVCFTQAQSPGSESGFTKSHKPL